ncbi:cadmium-translocating P-type ATPase [Pontibacter sp. BT310]|uniref:P-type Zn(2+) transporter n=1 Tax=Pontibacter populi TaxID=890055 RepID=A0ABS6XG07_9BACT|nr:MULTISPECIES: heavy metal translocating P-type ATPase [Pontibacter]MBJ6120075.1 cadmium-translocating P-type ATPase [Pontibacter sp. BT310]MBR0572504.1 cadmium-translocating P-type ATPase [Microvirga sp. STS03]MBW3366928.1 cadmium-translocating P-type ATPase [Pontibacter populi]
MDKNAETTKNIEEDFKPLEITSPRTAEAPGPNVGAECCSADGKTKVQGAVDHAHAEEEAKSSYVPTILSLLLLLGGILLDYLDTPWFTDYIRFITFGIAYVLVGWRVVWHAIRSLRSSFFNEFFLMTMATLGAFYIGEYAEGVAVMLFYVIGEHFQEAAVLRSRRSIKALIDNRPDEVGVVTANGVVSRKAKEVQIGEVVQVKAGEKIALDGELLTDRASFNTAALTGESKPDTKSKGEVVLAGMINLDQVIELKVTSAYENSALSKILKLVEEAGSRKAKTQQFITKFAKVYTPIVFFLAIGLTFIPYFVFESYDFNVWLYRALIFLVISCPCALVISIPLGYFGGIGAASRNGLLFKGSNFLDLMTQVDTVVMDKTGTLTEGVFQVQKIESVLPDKARFLSAVAAIESKSTHPIAQAIVAEAGQTYQQHDVSQVEEISGHGLKGIVDGKELLVGNGRLLDKFAVTYDPSIKEIVETIVLVAVDGAYAGYITIADKTKEDAPLAVKRMRELGVKKLVMLSGDKDSIVQKVAKELQLDEAYGGLLPQDKVAHVEKLKAEGRTVAFVGDGINDAPVITLADVGMAMGGLGSDAAIETADVVIQTDHPARIATAINIGKKTKQIVWQNIALAFGVKAIVLILGAGGLATMWEAVFADVGVAFLAILNAVRIQRMKFD